MRADTTSSRKQDKWKGSPGSVCCCAIPFKILCLVYQEWGQLQQQLNGFEDLMEVPMMM